MKMSKKILSCLLALSCLFALSSGLAEDDGAPLDGGWTPYETIQAPILTKDAEDAFTLALASWNGLPMDPAVLLATQLVSGTNYAFLAKVKILPERAASGWYIVTVYQDLQGNAKVTGAVEINPADLKTLEELPEKALLGAWEPAGTADAVTLPEEAWGPFWKASESYDGVSFNPLALIATQLVAGMNYLIVCQGTVMAEEPAEALYFVTLYVDLEGNGEITDAQLMDIAAYRE